MPEIKDLETLQVALVASLLSRPSPNAGVDVSSSSDVTVATVDSYQASIGPIVLSVPRTRNGWLRLLSVRSSAVNIITPYGCDANPHTDEHAQGLEKPIIILSTAVTRVGAFVADPNRLNVALTRAKHHLILVRMALPWTPEGHTCETVIT